MVRERTTVKGKCMDNYMILAFLMYTVGAISEAGGAKWTIDVVRHSYMATAWAGLWSLINLIFAMTLVHTQDWVLGICYVLGVVMGTWAIIAWERHRKKRKKTRRKLTKYELLMK